MSTGHARPSRGYPLVALFLILTACGVVAALVGPALRGIFDGSVGGGGALVACLISVLISMCLGAVIGLFHYHRLRGFFWGLVTGVAVGVFAGPMVVAPRSALGTMLSLSFGGAVAVVLVTIAFLLAGRSTQQS